MDALDKLRARLAVAVMPKSTNISSPFQVISTRPANIPVYTDMTVRKATREGYKTSIYVFRAVRTIVQAASAIPWFAADKKGEPIEGHPFTKLMKNPNPEFSGQDMIELLIAHLELVGNGLWMPVIVNKLPREIWPVMPDLVKPVPSDRPGEWLKGWQVTGYGGLQQMLPPDQFIHFMQMDPGNLHWGTAPLIAAAKTIDTDNEAQDTQKISMQNRATPDGVFTHEAMLSQEQFEEARRQIRENFLAKSKKREPWVLGAGAKWNQMSMTPVEMDFVLSRLRNLRDIAGAFGISPLFLGDLEQSSYNNMMEARKALYEDVAIPLLDDIKSTLNLKLAPLYKDITITYDISKVAALREDFSKKVEQAKSLWNMGIPFEQINERLEMGFDKFEGWDVGYLQMQMIPVSAPSREEPKPEGEEPEEEESGVDKALRAIKAFGLQTENQKTVYWKRVDRMRIGWWGAVSKKIKPLYDTELKAIEAAIKGKDPKKLLDSATLAIYGEKPKWEKMMTAVLFTVVEAFGNETVDDITGKTQEVSEYKWKFDPFAKSAQKWIKKYGAKDVRSIASTNLSDVAAVISAGMDEDLSTPQIAKNLRQFYTNRSQYKAMRVARTEVCKASTFGNLEAARQSGIIKSKFWITSRDERVRDSHVALDGEAVPLDGMFSNGLRGPEEPMCRCVLGFSTEDVPAGGEAEVAEEINDWETREIEGEIRRPDHRVDIADLGDQADEWYEGLERHQMSGIKSWGADEYVKIRKYQLTGKIPAKDPDIAIINDNLMKTVKTAPDFKGTTYRGMRGLSKRDMARLAKTDTMEFNALTSTSVDPGKAMSFAGSWDDIPKSVFMEIHTESAKYIGTKYIRAEAEALLMPGTSYKIIGRSIKTIHATPPFGGDPVPIRALCLILKEIVL